MLPLNGSFILLDLCFLVRGHLQYVGLIDQRSLSHHQITNLIESRLGDREVLTSMTTNVWGDRDLKLNFSKHLSLIYSNMCRNPRPTLSYAGAHLRRSYVFLQRLHLRSQRGK